MKTIVAIALAVAIACPSFGASLPGFGAEVLGSTAGFLTSLAIDSRGTLYYTTQDGSIYRFENGRSTSVAKVASIGISDAGLLGMALLDDRTAIVHYTTPAADPELVTHDVIARIDLTTGAETVLRTFACDIEVPERGASPEHHGGNPVVAPDGSIFVGIGDYSGRTLAQLPEWNGGKIWRIYADGTAEQYVLGLRNPFDFVWDGAKDRLIVPDNGPIGREDELNIVTKGANCGWPWAFGNEEHPAGMVPPVYIWQQTMVPTGTLALRGANDQLRAGIVVTGYYSHAVHYIPDVDARPMPDPLIVVELANAELIDIAEDAAGTMFVADAFHIYRLITPRRGDCNGDGIVTSADLDALRQELLDGPEPRLNAQNGAYRGSWGCDANGDDVINASDAPALAAMMGRRRAVGR